MKKKFIRTGIISYFAMLILYLGIFFLICKVLGNDFDLWERLITAAIFAFQGPLFVWVNALNVFPRSNYLESNDITKPNFVDVRSTVIDMPQEVDFSRLKTEFSNKWTITFSDDVEKVLKFREKVRYFKKWGAAAWLQYDSDNRKIYLNCFTLAGMNYELTLRLQEEIEKCLESFV